MATTKHAMLMQTDAIVIRRQVFSTSTHVLVENVLVSFSDYDEAGIAEGKEWSSLFESKAARLGAMQAELEERIARGEARPLRLKDL